MTSVKIRAASSLTFACHSLTRIRFENLKCLSLTTRNVSSLVLVDIIVPTLVATAHSLESLSLDDYHRNLHLSLLCPALKTFAVHHFTRHSWNLVSCFPNLSTVRIQKVNYALSRTLRTCPASIRKVEIGIGQNLSEVKESLWSLYHFFSPRAKSWELPYEYVEDFCDFIASEQEGRGVKSVTIGFVSQPSRDFHWPHLAKGLEKTVNLLDLEDLTLKACGSGFSSSTWNSLSPQIFRRLHTFTIFSSMGFTELPELVSKLRLVRKVVLVWNQPVRLDAKAEQVFSALPNATVRYKGDQGIAEIKFQDHWEDYYVDSVTSSEESSDED